MDSTVIQPENGLFSPKGKMFVLLEVHKKSGPKCILSRICSFKGQLISKCHFGVFNSSKKRTKQIRLKVPQ